MEGGNKHDNTNQSTLESCFDWDVSRLDNNGNVIFPMNAKELVRLKRIETWQCGIPLRRVSFHTTKNRIVSTLHEVMPIPTYFVHSIGWSQYDNLVLMLNSIVWWRVTMKMESLVPWKRRHESYANITLRCLASIIIYRRYTASHPRWINDRSMMQIYFNWNVCLIWSLLAR